ncbi:MAG TPA: hypothetical protein VHN82_08845, partial [Methanoregula sp.]|nr:hypothetical protein [Methanoregula sp.]
MATGPGTESVTCPGVSPPAWAVATLWAVVLLAAVFACLVFVIPLDLYRLIGHVFEAAAALFCMACCLYAYRFISDRIIFPLAAFAFFGYALSTFFWYYSSVSLGRAFVYTSVAEISFICFFLFLIAAISIEFPQEKIPRGLPVILFVVLFVIPILVVWGFSVSQPLHLALFALRCFLVALLADAMIRHGLYRYPLLCAGISLRCAGSIIYGLRETVILNSPPVFLPGPLPGSQITLYNFFSIVGPINICSFALIVLGLFA